MASQLQLQLLLFFILLVCPSDMAQATRVLGKDFWFYPVFCMRNMYAYGFMLYRIVECRKSEGMMVQSMLKIHSLKSY